jgi:diguanylate cyclase (GGDEF)-like protein
VLAAVVLATNLTLSLAHLHGAAPWLVGSALLLAVAAPWRVVLGSVALSLLIHAAVLWARPVIESSTWMIAALGGIAVATGLHVVWLIRTHVLARLARAERLSGRDEVTELFNQTSLDHEMAIAVDASRRWQAATGLALIDIDHLGVVNTAQGRDKGDQALRAVARELQSSARRSDRVFRTGGDGFAVLLNGATRDSILAACERLRTRVELHTPMSISIGAAVLGFGERPDEWFARALDALSAAKTKGRNRTELRDTGFANVTRVTAATRRELRGE